MMKKKGQGISLETIIVAAIVLVVLVVLWAIFTGRLSLFSDSLSKEEAKAKFIGAQFSNCKVKDFETKLTGAFDASGKVIAAKYNELKTEVDTCSAIRDQQSCELQKAKCLWVG